MSVAPRQLGEAVSHNLHLHAILASQLAGSAEHPVETSSMTAGMMRMPTRERFEQIEVAMHGYRLLTRPCGKNS